MPQVHYPPGTVLRSINLERPFVALAGDPKLELRTGDAVAIDAWRMDGEEKWHSCHGIGWDEAKNLSPITDPDEADRILADYTAWRLLNG